MRTKKLFSTVVILLLAVLLASCSGGGGGSTPSGDTPSGDTPPGGTTPLFTGFDFTLKQGDFWRYAWDYRYVYQSSGTNTDVRITGVYQIALGAPIVITGITAYAIQIAGDTQVNDGGAITILAPTKWKYLAVDNYRLLGSTDGLTLTVLFDAMKGLWPGSGYFTNFGPSVLYTATSSIFSNAYVNIAAVAVGKSSSTSQCEYFPDVGSICGSDLATDRTEKEYYAGGLGPAGYYYRLGIDFGGSYPAWSETKTNIGLYGSSFWGQSAEAEANNSSASAQSLGIPTILACDASEDDPGTKQDHHSERCSFENNGDQDGSRQGPHNKSVGSRPLSFRQRLEEDR